MTYKAYAGIGSRETPADILDMMSNFAWLAADLGWTLRSGAAVGADTAFEAGVPAQQTYKKEIYLPWGRYNNNESKRTHPTDLAIEMASRMHPNWDACTDGAKKLHGRNVQIILGERLNDPVKFVLCWTKAGQLIGGTAMAIRIASMYRVPIFNLGADIDEAALEAIVRGQ